MTRAKSGRKVKGPKSEAGKRIAALEAQVDGLQRKVDALLEGLRRAGTAAGLEIVPPAPAPVRSLRVVRDEDRGERGA